MARTKQYNFGVGRLFLRPSGSNPTPIPIGTVQEASVDITTSKVELHGENQFPVDIARGKGTISGKFKTAEINTDLLNSIFSGSTKTAGSTAVLAQTADIPATPYQITVTNGADFAEDFGVIDNATGLPMARVAGTATPATGEYKVDEVTGEYTFAAADTTHSVTITYAYTLATGSTVAVTNPLMGAGVNYVLQLAGSYKGLTSGLTLHSVIIEKVAMAWKNDAHTITDADFSAAADDNDKVFTIGGGGVLTPVVT